LVVLVPVFTFTLGIWQVKRLRWKLDLIDEIQRNVERDPMILPPNIKWVNSSSALRTSSS
jgi:surfeit locus 1 family protein